MAGKTIGFIGLGIMGFPMAGHLKKAGHKIVAFDVVPAARERGAEAGFQIAASSKEATVGADVVISMVPDSPHVEAVYLGEDGVLAGAKAGTLLLDMSTISPVTAVAVAKAAAEKGCLMLDAPVSGGDTGAKPRMGGRQSHLLVPVEHKQCIPNPRRSGGYAGKGR